MDEVGATTEAGIWIAYELEEAEAWDEYAESPDYLAGRLYLLVEERARKRRERDLQRLRYRQESERRKRLDDAECPVPVSK